MSDSDLKVLGICGSLRKKSFNMAALRAAGELMPPGMSLRIASIAERSRLAALFLARIAAGEIILPETIASRAIASCGDKRTNSPWSIAT